MDDVRRWQSRKTATPFCGRAPVASSIVAISSRPKTAAYISGVRPQAPARPASAPPASSARAAAVWPRRVASSSGVVPCSAGSPSPGRCGHDARHDDVMVVTVIRCRKTERGDAVHSAALVSARPGARRRPAAAEARRPPAGGAVDPLVVGPDHLQLRPAADRTLAQPLRPPLRQLLHQRCIRHILLPGVGSAPRPAVGGMVDCLEAPHRADLDPGLFASRRRCCCCQPWAVAAGELRSA